MAAYSVNAVSSPTEGARRAGGTSLGPKQGGPGMERVQMVAVVQKLVPWEALGLCSHEGGPLEGVVEGGSLVGEGACGGGDLGSDTEGALREGVRELEDGGGEEGELGEGWGAGRGRETWNADWQVRGSAERWVGTGLAGICCRASGVVQEVGGVLLPAVRVGVALAYEAEGGDVHSEKEGEDHQNSHVASTEDGVCDPSVDLPENGNNTVSQVCKTLKSSVTCAQRATNPSASECWHFFNIFLIMQCRTAP